MAPDERYLSTCIDTVDRTGDELDIVARQRLEPSGAPATDQRATAR